MEVSLHTDVKHLLPLFPYPDKMKTVKYSAARDILEEMEEKADKSKPVAHNMGDMVYVDSGRGWWFLFRQGTRYEDGKFILKTDESTL